VVPPKAQGEQVTQLGNKTECGLLGFMMNMGQSYDELRKQTPEEDFHKVYTFNSNRKSMSTVINLPNGGYRVLSKGASEIILKRFSSSRSIHLSGASSCTARRARSRSSSSPTSTAW